MPPSPPCCYTWVPPSPLADSWVPPSPLTELLLLGTPVAFGRARRLGSRRGAAATAAFHRVLTYLPGSRLLRPQPLAIRPDLPSGSQYFCRDLASPFDCGRRYLWPAGPTSCPRRSAWILLGTFHPVRCCSPTSWHFACGIVLSDVSCASGRCVQVPAPVQVPAN